MKRYGLLVVMSLAACMRSDYDGSTADADSGNSTLRLFAIAGPQVIESRTCAGPYEVWTEDISGNEFSPASTLAVAFTAQSGMTLYSDAACRTSTSGASIIGGTSRAAFYTRQDLATSFRVEATAAGNLPGNLPVLAVDPFWHPMSPAAYPSRRLFSVGTYHPVRQTTFIYAGTTTGSTIYDDLWEYDGTTWTPLCTGCAPGARYGHGLAYDEAGARLIVFGGTTGVYPAGSATGAVNSLWLWNGAWSPAAYANPPPARWLLSMAYDPVRQSTVVFGGEGTNGAPRDDVYELAGSTWIGPLQPTPRPAPRTGAATAYVAAAGGIVIFGGEDAGGGWFDDMWSWNGTRWLQLCNPCTGQARRDAMLADYPVGNALYLVNGFAGGDVVGTWRFDHAAPVSPVLVTALPGGRDSAAMAYDALRRRLVLFGGNGGGCTNDCDQTWEFGFP